MRGVHQNGGHYPMNKRGTVLPPLSALERQVRLVNHYVDTIPIPSRPFPEPKAKRQIHRFIAKSVRNPLNHKTTWAGKPIKLLAGFGQISRPEGAEYGMHLHSEVSAIRAA
jgi:hypothetical protein